MSCEKEAEDLRKAKAELEKAEKALAAAKEALTRARLDRDGLYDAQQAALKAFPGARRPAGSQTQAETQAATDMLRRAERLAAEAAEALGRAQAAYAAATAAVQAAEAALAACRRKAEQDKDKPKPGQSTPPASPAPPGQSTPPASPVPPVTPVPPEAPVPLPKSERKEDPDDEDKPAPPMKVLPQPSDEPLPPPTRPPQIGELPSPRAPWGWLPWFPGDGRPVTFGLNSSCLGISGGLALLVGLAVVLGLCSFRVGPFAAHTTGTTGTTSNTGVHPVTPPPAGTGNVLTIQGQGYTIKIEDVRCPSTGTLGGPELQVLFLANGLEYYGIFVSSFPGQAPGTNGFVFNEGRNFSSNPYFLMGPGVKFEPGQQATAEGDLLQNLGTPAKTDLRIKLAASCPK